MYIGRPYESSIFSSEASIFHGEMGSLGGYGLVRLLPVQIQVSAQKTIASSLFLL